MSRNASPFYPPRAKWHRRWTYLGMALRRKFRLGQVTLPDQVGLLRFLASLALPGYALFLFQRPAWGWAIVAAYSLAALVFLAALGYTAGSIAFGLMIAAHVNSALFLLKRTVLSDDQTIRSFSFVVSLAVAAAGLHWFLFGWAAREDNVMTKMLAAMLTVLFVGLGVYWVLVRFAGDATEALSRVVLAAATLAFYGGCIYWPLLQTLEARLLVPLRVDNRVIVVNRLAKRQAVARGDPVAYVITGAFREGIALASGYGFDKVLALPGETVRFNATSFEVNGQVMPRLPAMPQTGAWPVPEKRWFVWPHLDIGSHRGAADSAVLNALRNVAMVSENQFIGRPFRYWFWRRQALP